MNDNNKVISEADIRCIWTGKKKGIMIVYYIALAIIFYINGPAKCYKGTYGETYYIWGMKFYSEGISRLTSARDADTFFSTLLDDKTNELNIMPLIIGIVITVVLIILPIFIFSRIKAMINESSIELEAARLTGYRRLFNTRYTIDVPLEGVRAISYKRSLFEQLTYGSTILIVTNKGNDTFHGVHNSDDFIEAVKKALEKKRTNEIAVKADRNETIEKMNSLKKMLDSGLVSQEEFEQKKAELLSKM